MEKRLLKMLMGSAIATLGSAIAIAAPATAGTLHTKAGFDIEWNYSIDQHKDGYSRNPSILNYNGMALAETDDQFIFALSSDLNYNETDSNFGMTHGDLFLNFSGEKFHTANENNNLFAVKFASNNNTGVAAGIYRDVVAGPIDDSRWDSLTGYYSSGHVFSDNSYGTDLSGPNDVYDYFYSLDTSTATINNTPLYNGIQSGTKLGDVSLLDVAALETLGLDLAFPNFHAEDVFGIAIDKSLFAGLLPSGESELMAHVTMEYGDGVALKGSINIPEEETPTDSGTPSDNGTAPQDVPEPATLLGLSAIALAFLRCKRSHSTHLKT